MRQQTPQENERTYQELREMRRSLDALKAAVPPAYARQYLATMDRSLAEIERLLGLDAGS